MELNNCKKKISLLFDRFTKDNYHLSTYYSKALLKYFENSADKSIEKQLLETSFFSDLVIHYLVNVDKIVCGAIKTFILELSASLMRNELQFCKIVHLYGHELILTKLCAIEKKNPTPDLQLAFYKMHIGPLSHSSGVLSLINQKVWSRVLIPEVHTKPKPVAKTAYKFITQFVWKLNELEEEKVLIEVLHYIVSPIMTSVYHKGSQMDLENEADRSNSVKSFIEALLAIFDETCIYIKENIIVNLLDRYFIIQSYLFSVVGASRDDDLLDKTTDLLFRIHFAVCKTNITRLGKSENELLQEVLTNYINILKILIQKRNIKVISKFLIKCLIFWSKVGGQVVSSSFKRDEQQIDVRIQLVLLLVDPILSYAYLHNKEKSLETFFLKLNTLTTEHIFKTHCMLNCLIVEADDIKNTCLQCLKELFKLQGNLNITQAGIIYQSLFYILESHVQTDESGGLILNDYAHLELEDFKIISWVFDIILNILKEHQINWYENIEIISFQSTIVNLLKQNILPSKLLLQAMSLIDWSIKNFLSPDLSLLVESKSGSTLNEISKLLSLYFEHPEWEIRDSALQILLSCLEVSFVKYVPLQKLILDNRLLIDAVKKISDDPEYYVQDTALKCLAAAAKIESIWKEVTRVYPNIYIQLIIILKNNPEGILRKEAACVITEIYVNQRLSSQFLLHLYRIMTVIILDDLYWEVHLAVLGFWRQVIQRGLSDRGAIDGKFPSVIFCKEKRKIVTLNHSEILKQLSGLMNFLSSVGCLTVLQECLKDDRNLKVMEQAYFISKNLMDILDYYKFDGVPNGSLPNTECEFKNVADRLKNTDEEFAEFIEEFACQNLQNRDTVIDSILSIPTTYLIQDMIDNYTSVKSEYEVDAIIQSNRNVKMIKPNEFLSLFKQTDYLCIFREKENWNCCSLDSVLDEILSLDIKVEDTEFHCK